MKLQTETFGTQEYEEASIVHLPEGMLGFSRLTRYILIEQEAIKPFRWLQCLDASDLAFPVVDPHLLVGQYSASIPPRELEKLDIHNSSDMITLVVAIIAEDPAKSSVNLKAPLLINHRNMTGRQVILTESAYDVRTPVMEEARAAATAS